MLDSRAFQELITALLILIGIMTVAVSPIVKSTVDIIRQAAPTLAPRVYPIAALVLSLLVAACIVTILKWPFSAETAAFVIIAAITSMNTAVGTTELQNKGNDAVGRAKAKKRGND